MARTTGRNRNGRALLPPRFIPDVPPEPWSPRLIFECGHTEASGQVHVCKQSYIVAATVSRPDGAPALTHLP